MSTVSHSEGETFTTCERKHYYSYGLELQGKGRNIGDGLYRGSLGHTGMAAYYQAKYERSKFPLQAAMQAVISGVNIGGREDLAIMGQVVAILQKYHEYTSDRDAELEVVEVESSRLYEINPQLDTQIRPDLIVRQPGHGLQAWDHKWLFNFLGDTSLNLLPQLPKYQAGLLDAGLEIRSCWYNMVRYRELKPDPKLSKEDNYAKLFRRVQLPMTTSRRTRTVHEHGIVATRVSYLKSLPLDVWEKAIVRTPNDKACGFCSFSDLCINDIHGRDSKLMIEEEYEPKTKRELVESAGP